MAGNADSKQQNRGCDESVATEGSGLMLQTLRHMHDWIYAYVSRNLHEAVPVDEFSNKLPGRLAALEHSRTSCVKEAIGKAVSDLVHDLNRTAARRQARFVPRAEFDEVIDEQPNVEDLLIEREREKKALMALSGLKEKDREVVEQLCGIHRDRLTRKQIAKKLGLERNSIDQQMKRIIDSIRNALGT